MEFTGLGLNSNDKALVEALKKVIIERNLLDQKISLFGEKIGNWNNTEGLVFSLEKILSPTSYDKIWYRSITYRNLDVFNKFNKKRSLNPDLYLEYYCNCSDQIHDNLGKDLISSIYKHLPDKEKLINEPLACNLFKTYFNRIYYNWSGENNTNKHRDVVAMIGSTRFQNTFIEKCWELSAKGFVVTLPNFRPATQMAKGFDIPEEILEDIGFKRIDMADKVYVVNEDGYIGDSTRKEIAYAKSIGKNIKYMEE